MFSIHKCNIYFLLYRFKIRIVTVNVTVKLVLLSEPVFNDLSSIECLYSFIVKPFSIKNPFHIISVVSIFVTTIRSYNLATTWQQDNQVNGNSIAEAVTNQQLSSNWALGVATQQKLDSRSTTRRQMSSWRSP